MKSPEITVPSITALVGRTWFQVSDEGDNIMLETRDGGDVGEGVAGEADKKEGLRLIDVLRKGFPPSNYVTEFEVIDEWVSVTIRKLPMTATEKSERARQIRLSGLEKRMKAAIDAENASVTAPHAGCRAPYSYYLSRARSCAGPDVLIFSANYGQRILYRTNRCADFVFADRTLAEAALSGLVDRIRGPKASYPNEVRAVTNEGPTASITYNCPAPNNVIERSGKVSINITV